MSAHLVAKALAGGHADQTLFEGLDLTVAPGDVVGVVGANGAGKTTLLRILAGDLEPLGGSVASAPADAFVGWLPQEHERVPGESVEHYVARRTGVAAATEAMERAAVALGEGGGSRAADDAYARALDHWQASGAPDLDERLPAVLADLGLAVDPDTAMTALSGGQAARAALAALLLSRFDVVLLDEPTNDLDLDGLERLEAFVRGLRSGVVLVSHDREFLSRVVTRVVELDLAQHRVAVHDGGYDAFLEERAVARRHAREAYEEFAGQKADLVARARTQREWSSQGVRNAMRKSPDNDKIRRKAQAESSEKQARKVRQMESRIARLEEVEEPRKEWALRFSIGSAPRSSSVVATLDEAVVGARALHPRPGLAAGRRRRPDRRHRPQRCRQDDAAAPPPRPAGPRHRAGLPRRLGRRRRDRPGPHRPGRGPPPRHRVRDGRPRDDARRRADPARQVRPPGRPGRQPGRPALPGERTRAAMALLQARGVNLLVLDEPTNHLDLPAIEQLEEALESYDGSLLLVSHDRRLLDGVRLDQRWHVDAGRVTTAPGG